MTCGSWKGVKGRTRVLPDPPTTKRSRKERTTVESTANLVSRGPLSVRYHSLKDRPQGQIDPHGVVTALTEGTRPFETVSCSLRLPGTRHSPCGRESQTGPVAAVLRYDNCPAPTSGARDELTLLCSTLYCRSFLPSSLCR